MQTELPDSSHSNKNTQIADTHIHQTEAMGEARDHLIFFVNGAKQVRIIWNRLLSLLLLLLAAGW